jgi:hypothetical protein
MQTLHAQIDIEAPAERVWGIVADFTRYPEWNPFIIEASGQLRVGSRLDVSIRAPGMKPVHFHPRVLDYRPGWGVRWKGSLWVSGLFDGRHSLVVQPLDETTSRFTTHEEVSGILLPLLGRAMKASQQGFEEMSRALKERAEAQ